MDEKIFNRVEKKYLLTKDQYQHTLDVIKKYMQEDSYFKSEVFNIYFDTDNYDLIIQSIDHPDFKEKLRARSYGSYDKVFFEIKTKLLGRAMLEDTIDERDDNLGYKRRVLITHKDYDDFIARKASMYDLAHQSVEKPADLQIAKEIDYLITHFNLKPKIFVRYDRTSYRGDNELRITFDENLKYRDRNLEFANDSHDKVLLRDKKCIIMEIKAQGGMPLWLVKTLSAERIYPERFSKIGKIYETIRKEKNV